MEGIYETPDCARRMTHHVASPLKLSIAVLVLSLATTNAQIVRSYGETCFFDVQCNDHRMVCEPDSSNTSVRRCLCDRMHVWSIERKECLMTLNITEMLASLDLSEFSDKLAKEDQKVFVGVVIAGITVVILGALLTFMCIFYGCCLDKCFDKWERLESGEVPRRSECGPSCPEFVQSTTPKSGFT